MVQTTLTSIWVIPLLCMVRERCGYGGTRHCRLYSADLPIVYISDMKRSIAYCWYEDRVRKSIHLRSLEVRVEHLTQSRDTIVSIAIGYRSLLIDSDCLHRSASISELVKTWSILAINECKAGMAARYR